MITPETTVESILTFGANQDILAITAIQFDRVDALHSTEDLNGITIVVKEVLARVEHDIIRRNKPVRDRLLLTICERRTAFCLPLIRLTTISSIVAKT